VKVLQLVLAEGSNDLRVFDDFNDVLSLSLEFFKLSKYFFLLLSEFYFKTLSMAECQLVSSFQRHTSRDFLCVVNLLVQFQNKINHVGVRQQLMLGFEQIFGCVNLYSGV
jgi:hypothetical protein